MLSHSYSHSIPMLRAVPWTMRVAFSRSAVLRSLILILAISRTFSADSLPTLVVPGVPLPFSTTNAFLNRSVVGGVFMVNENERSSYTIISTGMTLPSWDDVRSLYSVQKAIMLTPCCPSAGPTGGAGVAFPAGNCSLIIAFTFFAIFTISLPVENQVRRAFPAQKKILTLSPCPSLHRFGRSAQRSRRLS